MLDSSSSAAKALTRKTFSRLTFRESVKTIFGVLWGALLLPSCGYQFSPTAPGAPGPRPPFSFQSKINTLPCQNEFRPNGRFVPLATVTSGTTPLEVVRAEVYVELQDDQGRALRSASGRMSPNSISGEFSAIILCSAALAPSLSAFWGMAMFPMAYHRQESLIPSDIGIIFPSVGEDMNWTHPAYVQRFSPTERSISKWLDAATASGQIEIYDDGGDIEVMASQLFSPMQDGTRWLQFFLARYRAPRSSLTGTSVKNQ